MPLLWSFCNVVSLCDDQLQKQIGQKAKLIKNNNNNNRQRGIIILQETHKMSQEIRKTNQKTTTKKGKVFLHKKIQKYNIK